MTNRPSDGLANIDLILALLKEFPESLLRDQIMVILDLLVASNQFDQALARLLSKSDNKAITAPVAIKALKRATDEQPLTSDQLSQLLAIALRDPSFEFALTRARATRQQP